VFIKDERPSIPKFIFPSTQKLIMDCWAKEPEERPSFAEIVERLSEMKFKIMPNVNSAKLREFVKKIEESESPDAATQQ
jgi:hypothetical protein